MALSSQHICANRHATPHGRALWLTVERCLTTPIRQPSTRQNWARVPRRGPMAIVTPRVLTGEEAAAAVHEELGTVLDKERRAEADYHASVCHADLSVGAWYEYGQDIPGTWSIWIVSWGRYEADTNVHNRVTDNTTLEMCASRAHARAVATARNLGQPDPPAPVDSAALDWETS